MFLLDTNIISEVRKGPRCDAKVSAWYDKVPPGELFLSVLVLAEIRRGILAVEARDPRRADSLDAWYAALKKSFANRILPISQTVAELWAELNSKRTYPFVDGFLAATATAHNLTLVTRNTDDVGGSHVRYVNPFVDARVRVAK